MAQLAIKGHETSGNEVIEILEMLGGKNKRNLKGTDTNLVYYICSEGYIDTLYSASSKHYKIFTLEEFLEKYPYKVWDKVKAARINDFIGRIKNIRWDGNENQIIYVVEWDDITKSTLPYFVEGLQPYKEEIMEEKKINQMSLANCELDEVEIFLGDKFELKIKEGKYYAVKKQPQYPKSYTACAKILECFSAAHIDGYKCELLEAFQELLICRDAYWKIAGEQMGLDKPWEPDWKDESENKYTIVLHGNNNCYANCKGACSFLTFPTAEMRDTFYDNFKGLIEVCKEFL